jgi:hypothetical protein
LKAQLKDKKKSEKKDKVSRENNNVNGPRGTTTKNSQNGKKTKLAVKLKGLSLKADKRYEEF